MSRRNRFALCVAVIAGTGAVGASPALASVAAVDSGGDLRVTDQPNTEFNDIRVFYESAITPPQVNVSDSQGITPGAGCVTVTATRVRCADSPAIQSIVVLLGGNQDTFLAEGGAFALPFGLPVEVSGEAGADTITGSRNSDVLNGGSGNDDINGKGGEDLLGGFGDSGRDEFFGGTGVDKIKAADGERDRQIDCGAGDDRRAQRDSNDPQPRSC